MWPVSAELLSIVQGSADIRRRISILDADLLTVLPGVQVTSAPVRVNPSISRRTATISLPMTDAVRDLIDDDHPWRIEHGVWIPSREAYEWVPVFTGWPDEDSETFSAAGSTASIPFRGRERLADGAVFDGPASFLRGTRLRDMVRALCEMAGMGTDDDLYRLDDGGRILTVDHGYEEDVNLLATIDQVTRDNGCDFACDPESVMVLRPIPDLDTAPVVATYRRGAGGGVVPMTEFTRVRTRRPKNVFVVVGEGGWQPVRAQLPDEATVDRMRAAGTPIYLDRYTSAGIATQDQANDVCRARYLTRGSIEVGIDVAAPPNPALDYLDVVNLAEPSTRTAGRHFLQDFEVADGLVAQHLRTRVVRPLATTAPAADS